MTDKQRLIYVGIIFLLTLLIFIWGFFYLKGIKLLKSTYSYFAVYDNVAGLTKGTPVTISGYQVGQVYNISFSDQVPPKAIVHIILQEDIKIPKNSVAEIYSVDIMGNKGIRILLNPNSAEYYQEGDTLVAKVEKDLMQEVNEQLMPLKIRTEQLLSSFDSVLFIVQAIFNKNTRQNIYSSFTNISQTISNLEHTTYVLDTMISNKNGRIQQTITAARNLAKLLDNNQQTLQKIMTDLEKISDSLSNAELKQLVNNTEQSLYNLNQILEKINRGEGNLGKLLNEDSLYINIQEITYNLNLLLKDLQQNPKRYINVSLINLGRYYQTQPEKQKNEKN